MPGNQRIKSSSSKAILQPPNIHNLHNKCSKDLKALCLKYDIHYQQVVPLKEHRADVTQCAISTFMNNLVAILRVNFLQSSLIILHPSVSFGSRFFIWQFWFQSCTNGRLVQRSLHMNSLMLEHLFLNMVESAGTLDLWWSPKKVVKDYLKQTAKDVLHLLTVPTPSPTRNLSLSALIFWMHMQKLLYCFIVLFNQHHHHLLLQFQLQVQIPQVQIPLVTTVSVPRVPMPIYAVILPTHMTINSKGVIECSDTSWCITSKGAIVCAILRVQKSNTNCRNHWITSKPITHSLTFDMSNQDTATTKYFLPAASCVLTVKKEKKIRRRVLLILIGHVVLKNMFINLNLKCFITIKSCWTKVHLYFHYASSPLLARSQPNQNLVPGGSRPPVCTPLVSPEAAHYQSPAAQEGQSS